MIDKNKQYTTRSGLPVEIYVTDRGGVYPVHGVVLEGDTWCPRSWTSEGNLIAGHLTDFDLIEVKPRIQLTAWINVYDWGEFAIHYSREDADEYASPQRIACIEIKIDYEEGEGL